MSGFATNGLPAQTNALTGNELFAIDTQYAQGINPESAAAPAALHSKTQQNFILTSVHYDTLECLMTMTTLLVLLINTQIK